MKNRILNELLIDILIIVREKMMSIMEGHVKSQAPDLLCTAVGPVFGLSRPRFGFI